MGYIFVVIALLAGSTKGYFGKRISGIVSTHRQSVLVNAVRMLICVFISAGMIALEGLQSGVLLDGAAWWTGALAGVTVSVFMVTWLLSVRQGAFMLISVSQMFGVVVTLVCSRIVFQSPILPRQIIAVGILIVAVLIMGSYSAALKGGLGLSTVILLLLCGVSSGLYDFSLKLFTHYSASSISALNLISYVIAAIALGFVFLIPTGEAQFKVKPLLRATGLPLIIMSACLFLNSYFKALANNYFTPVQLYPIYQAGGLILSALMAAVFFKEKITPRCIIGMVLAFAAIILLK